MRARQSTSGRLCDVNRESQQRGFFADCGGEAEGLEAEVVGMGPLASAGPTRQRATDRREETQAACPVGSSRAWQNRREWVDPLLTKFFNERTRRVRTTTTLYGCLRVEKEVVLDGDAAGFSAALDSRQAAAKRADRDRRATHAPQSSLFEVAASFAGGVSNASTLSVRDGRRWQVVP